MNFSKTINENKNENIEKKENKDIDKKNITYKYISTEFNNIFSNTEKEIKDFIIEEEKLKSGKKNP